MDKKTRTCPEYIDCACVIHDVLYSWEYVERLYYGLQRNLTPKVRMHVYTEADRPVPDTMIKHSLIDWPHARGPKKSWWYKVQLFNTQFHNGPLLYFDLDTIVVRNIDWIWQLPLERFWAVRDFKHLYRRTHNKINSSVMWFDTSIWANIYRDFDPKKLPTIRSQWHGDQDYIDTKIPDTRRHYFDRQLVRSWRWELVDGGWDFARKKHRAPGTGTVIDDKVGIIVFHGDPKPHEITDPVVLQYWR